MRRFWLCLDRKLNNQGRNGLTIIPFILHVNPQCLTSSVEHNADPIQNQKMQRTHSDVSVILTCACSTYTPGCGHSPAPPLQAVQQTQAKSATKAPTTNSSLGNAHTHATTHRVAAVDEVVALRGEAAQHAVLLLRRRGPAHPPPQPAAAQSAVRGNRQNFEHRNIVASDASD